MVSGLSGVWLSLFLQRILMSRLHPAILRPSTGQSSESLPWSSLAFPGLPWPSLAWSTVVCLVFAGLPSCSLAFPRLPRDCLPICALYCCTCHPCFQPCHPCCQPYQSYSRQHATRRPRLPFSASRPWRAFLVAASELRDGWGGAPGAL